MTAEFDLAQLARASVQRLTANDLDGFLEFVDPEVEFTSLIAEMEGETYRGHDGVRQWWATVRDSFEVGQWEYEELHVAGEHGVGRLRIRGRMGGVPVEQPMWQAFRVRDGLATWWAFYRDERDARAAVGMDE